LAFYCVADDRLRVEQSVLANEMLDLFTLVISERHARLRECDESAFRNLKCFAELTVASVTDLNVARFAIAFLIWSSENRDTTPLVLTDRRRYPTAKRVSICHF
jgi:hypothetical protein